MVFLWSVAFFNGEMLMFDSDPLFPSSPACVPLYPRLGWVVLVTFLLYTCPWYVNTLMSSLNKNDISLVWSLSLELRIVFVPHSFTVHGCALLFPPLGRQWHPLPMFPSVQAWPFCRQFLFSNADRLRNRFFFFLVKINHIIFMKYIPPLHGSTHAGASHSEVRRSEDDLGAVLPFRLVDARNDTQVTTEPCHPL